MKDFLEKLNWVAVLSIAVAVLTQIGNGSMSLAHQLPAAWLPGVQEATGNIGSVLALIVSAGAYGRVPASSIPSVPTVVKVLIVAFLLSLFLGNGPALAQGKLKLAPPAATGNLQKDLHTDAENLGLIPSQPSVGGVPLTGNIEKDAQALWKKIASLTKADLTYAMAKAKAANTNASAVRLQCLQAISDANDAANGAGLKNPDGTPMERPDPALVTSIEDAAELVDNLSPQGKLFTSCAGAAQMFKTNTLAVINAIITGAAGIAALPAGL